MGTAEKFFLTPKDTDEYDNVPPLDMFDAEIDVYRVRNKIGYCITKTLDACECIMV